MKGIVEKWLYEWKEFWINEWMKGMKDKWINE